MQEIIKELEKLREDNKRLEDRVEKLTRDHTELLRIFVSTGKSYEEMFQKLDTSRHTLFERVMNIETKVFPELMQDLGKIDSIIKFDDEDNNPLDQRPKG